MGGLSFLFHKMFFPTTYLKLKMRYKSFLIIFSMLFLQLYVTRSFNCSKINSPQHQLGPLLDLTATAGSSQVKVGVKAENCENFFWGGKNCPKGGLLYFGGLTCGNTSLPLRPRMLFILLPRTSPCFNLWAQRNPRTHNSVVLRP